MRSIVIRGMTTLLLGWMMVGMVEAVSPPQAPTSDYTVGMFYMPAWKVNEAQNSWLAIDQVPGRKPLLGYYNGDSPEAWDWQIKWAVEHGVNLMVYDWFRCTGEAANIYYYQAKCEDNFNRPVDDTHLALAAELNEGFLKSSFKDKMKFAIMPTVALSWASVADLRDNVVPYWIERYFKLGNYYKVDGKPVIFLFDVGTLDTRGGKEAVEVIRSKVVAAGFPGVIILGDSNTFTLRDLSRENQVKNWGMDYVFQYMIFPYKVDGNTVYKPTEDQAIRGQYQAYEYLRSSTPLPFVMTATPMWDTYYQAYDREKPGEPVEYISPAGYRQVLQNIKTITNQLPANSLGRKLIMVDAWNEFVEGHYIQPVQEHGFDYLKSIREILTNKDNVPDYGLPTAGEMQRWTTLYDDYVSKHREEYALWQGKTITIDRQTKFKEVDNYGFPVESAANLTWGGWFKPVKLEENVPLLSKPFSFGILTTTDGSGHCVVATKNNAWYATGTAVLWPAGKLKANEWHQVICVYDGGRVKAYVDGQLMGTSTPDISGKISNAIYNVYVGNNIAISGGQFEGQVAKLIIKNQALTANEVAVLSQDRPVEAPTATPTLKPTVVPTNGPVVTLRTGDADGDGDTDLIDFSMWKREYSGNATTKKADFNNSGTVDLLDFSIWKREYSRE